MKIALKNVAIGSLVFALLLAATPTALMAVGEPPASGHAKADGFWNALAETACKAPHASGGTPITMLVMAIVKLPCKLL